MATNNSVNSPLSGTTGTGNFVGSTNPTLITPRIGTIYDASQNLPVISTANPPSAVNYFNFVGQSTGNPPEIQLTGSDTNIGLNLRAKGAGGFQLVSEALTTPLAIYNGTSSQHSTFFIFSNTAASRSVTFPDLSGTVALSGASQNVTFGTVQTSQINDTNGNANLAISATASAVNYMISTNSATGGYTGFEVAGSDTNANAFIKPKGDAGLAVITSAVSSTPFAIFSGTGQQHVTTFNFSNTSATRALTFPDITGNVNVGAATGGIGAWVLFNGTGTPAVTASSNVTSITDNGVGLYTVNITNALASANYAVSGSASGSGLSASETAIFSTDDANGARTTTTFRVAIAQPATTAGVYYDSATISAVVTL